jgi:ArsR family transcriptional regulator, arsenate/arsenite/antimonite-responsive transcriptional repressor
MTPINCRTETGLKQAVALLKALADETRLRILGILQERSLCVGGLARELGLTESAVSQHLQKLRRCGLITGEKQGYWTHYAVQAGALRDLAAALEEMSHRKRPLELFCTRKEQARACCCPARKPAAGAKGEDGHG